MLRDQAETIIRAHLALPAPDIRKANDDFKTQVIAAWKAENPGKKRAPKWESLQTWHRFSDMLTDAQAVVTAQQNQWYESKAVMELAVKDIIAQGLVPEAGEHRVFIAWVYAGSYSGQGYAAEKYAQHALEMEADKARHYGLEVEVDASEYNVYTFLRDPEVDKVILRLAPGPSLKEVVRRCWKRGVNPRVYMHSLPQGYENMAGLDYFGGEL